MSKLERRNSKVSTEYIFLTDLENKYFAGFSQQNLEIFNTHVIHPSIESSYFYFGRKFPAKFPSSINDCIFFLVTLFHLFNFFFEENRILDGGNPENIWLVATLANINLKILKTYIFIRTHDIL